MVDSSLFRKIASLSPEQLAKLRAHLDQRSTSVPILPREQLSNIASGLHIQLNGQDAWQATSTQARLWFLEQYLGPNPVHNIVRSLRLYGELNIAVLEATFKHIIERHEALRTTFHEVDGIPYQVIGDSDRFVLNVIDLQSVPKELQETEFQSQLQRWGRQPFNLAQDCLLRVILFQLDKTEFGLLFVVHHIVSDGWSFGVLAREISSLYRALVVNEASSLAPLSLQFADYSIWLQDQLRSGHLDQQRHYWQQKLSGELPILDLPCDRSRPPKQTYTGKQTSFQINASIVEGLKKLANQTGASLFMVLLASYKVLLYRYTHQTDIIVGTPTANRSQAALESLIGYFVDNLPLRTDLAGNPSFLELLERVRQTALDAYSNTYPFAEILESIQVERDHSRSPIFSTMMSLQNTPAVDFSLPGILLAAHNSENGVWQEELPISSYRFSPDIEVAHFDFIVLLNEEDKAITGVIEYNTDLFNSETIDQLIGHWQTLLQGILAEPHCSIDQLPLLNAAERHQLLVQWNNTATDYPRDACIHQLFEAQVERSPDAIAVVFKDQQLTYRELNTRANYLAHQLQAKGICPNMPVGICMNRSLEMMIGILGILKAGGAYVPLNPDYPHERLSMMLHDAEVKLVLTHSTLTAQLSSHPVDIMELDEAWSDDWDAIACEASTNKVASTDLAYIIYTSGSTGRPKGVAVPHRGVVRLVFDATYTPLDGQQVLLQLAPLSFDAATLEIWGALLHGGRCVLYPGDGVPEPKTLATVIQTQKVTTLWLTAALFNTIITESPECLKGIKELLVGGEALSVAHIRRAQELLPDTQLINGYGPTESTTFTCCYRIPRPLDPTVTSIPIGRAIANTEVYILSSHMQPVPIGVVGELYIGGDGLARGYINCPELTAERFIPNPFAATGESASTHLYKTGDQVRYLPDGTIEFIGRQDDQVKLRGFRIELGEIEVVLSQHSAVQQCAVILREDQPGDKRLVAYVVSSKTAAPTSQELQQFLQQTLPDFMVPAAFVMLNELPLTPNGKLDRRALPKPDPSQISSSTSFVAPRTDVEQELARIWAEVLQVERVGVQDNFFELGGHSLIATQMLSRIANCFHVTLSIRQLFEAPTIAQLAIAVEHQVQEIEAELMHLLSEVEDLSDQDAQQQLSQLTEDIPPRAI